MKSYKNRG